MHVIVVAPKPKIISKDKKEDISKYLGEEVGYLDTMSKTLKVKLGE